MAQLQHPLAVVVPIVTVRPERPGRIHDFLGTGFFVGPTRFLTARHVLDVRLPPWLAIATVSHDPLVTTVVDHIQLDPRRDIASGWGERPEGQATEYLQVEPTDVLKYNLDVMSVEYSSTRQGVPQDTGDRAIVFSPCFRKGNVVQRYTSDFGVASGSQCLDLSYPALKGASGAPVFYSDDARVVGMVVGNTERHLIPAQVTRVDSPDGVTEEVRYFLPVGQAIHAQHLREHLAAFPDP